MNLGKIKFILYFRNGMVLEKILGVTEDNLKGTMSILDATKLGFCEGRDFVLTIETLLIKGEDLIALDWQEIEEA